MKDEIITGRQSLCRQPILGLKGETKNAHKDEKINTRCVHGKYDSNNAQAIL